MIFWGQVRLVRSKCLFYQSKSWHSLIYGVPSINHAPGGRTAEKTHSFINQRLSEQHVAVRSFAAPVLAKAKAKDKGPQPSRMNKEIRAEYVRLVTDEGHSIISLREALYRATKLNLDLVEVQRKADPPVCKIMDFHKEKYKQKLKEKDRLKSKSELVLRKGECKEIRFTGKTEQKDLQMKAEMVKRLMERGYRVKCVAMGTEDEDLGGLLSQLSALIQDVAFVESGPRVEKRQALLVVRHAKFGPSKKGKKATTMLEAGSNGVPSVATSASTINSISPVQVPSQMGELTSESDLATNGEISSDHSESDWECGDEISSDQEVHALQSSETSSIIDQTEIPECEPSKETTWSAFGASDDFEKVFSFDGEGNHVASSFTAGMSDSANASPEEADLRELLQQIRPNTSSVNGSGKNQRQNTESSTAELPFGSPSLTSAADATRAKPAVEEVQIGRVVTPGDMSSHSMSSTLADENRYRGRNELKNRFQQFRPAERRAGITEAKLPPLKATMFPSEVERTHVNNQGPSRVESRQPEHPSANSRLQAHPPFTASVSPEHKIPKQPPFTASVSPEHKILEQPPVHEIQRRGHSDAKQGQSVPSFGIFSARNTAPPVDEIQRHGPSDAKLGQPVPSYGIFSARNTAASGDRKASTEANRTRTKAQ